VATREPTDGAGAREEGLASDPTSDGSCARSSISATARARGDDAPARHRGHSAEAPIDELRAFFREQEYSRMPVYQENLDNVLGFVFVKDLIKRAGEGTATGHRHHATGLLRARDQARARTAQGVPAAAGAVGHRGRRVRRHGGPRHLEDLLEEIVGEIRDEYDVEAEPSSTRGAGRSCSAGRSDVGDLAERLGVDVAGEGFETSAGSCSVTSAGSPSWASRWKSTG
jgi:hypothetical protein